MSNPLPPSDVPAVATRLDAFLAAFAECDPATFSLNHEAIASLIDEVALEYPLIADRLWREAIRIRRYRPSLDRLELLAIKNVVFGTIVTARMNRSRVRVDRPNLVLDPDLGVPHASFPVKIDRTDFDIAVCVDADGKIDMEWPELDAPALQAAAARARKIGVDLPSMLQGALDAVLQEGDTRDRIRAIWEGKIARP